jgi:hypothetical protein
MDNFQNYFVKAIPCCTWTRRKLEKVQVVVIFYYYDGHEFRMAQVFPRPLLEFVSTHQK